MLFRSGLASRFWRKAGAVIDTKDSNHLALYREQHTIRRHNHLSNWNVECHTFRGQRVTMRKYFELCNGAQDFWDEALCVTRRVLCNICSNFRRDPVLQQVEQQSETVATGSLIQRVSTVESCGVRRGRSLHSRMVDVFRAESRRHFLERDVRPCVTEGFLKGR